MIFIVLLAIIRFRKKAAPKSLVTQRRHVIYTFLTSVWLCVFNIIALVSDAIDYWYTGSDAAYWFFFLFLFMQVFWTAMLYKPSYMRLRYTTPFDYDAPKHYIFILERSAQFLRRIPERSRPEDISQTRCNDCACKCVISAKDFEMYEKHLLIEQAHTRIVCMRCMNRLYETRYEGVQISTPQ